MPVWGYTTASAVIVGGLYLGALGLPATASAEATIEGPPAYSSLPGLPDSRVYEQVSPTQKNGNQAGATSSAFLTGAANHYGIASPEGNSVLYEGTGPMGESPWAASLWFVSTKNTGGPGWRTRAVLPAAQQSLGEIGGLLKAKNVYLVQPSRDLSRTMLEAGATETLAPQPGAGA